MSEAKELTGAERIAACAADLGITMTAVFVPWSKSRNAGEKNPSLNWLVTLGRMAVIDGAYKPGSDRTILQTDYMVGCGNAPSYRQGAPLAYNTIAGNETVKAECETGFAHVWRDGFNRPMRRDPSRNAKPIMPELADVLYSLVSDASAIDHATFEDWASDYGYDADSRKAEAIYRACRDIGLKLRAALGDDGLAKLRTACEGY